MLKEGLGHVRAFAFVVVSFSYLALSMVYIHLLYHGSTPSFGHLSTSLLFGYQNK